MGLSILVHTFEGYSFAWPGFFAAWKESRMDFMNDVQKFWGTDVPGADVPDNWQRLYSGAGQWADRLDALLRLVPDEHILYMQEDHWPKIGLHLPFYYKIFKEKHLLRLQLSPVTRYYSLYGNDLPLYFNEKPKSKYIISHNPSIWDKNFLLSCLESGENPWENEYKATCRMWQNPDKIHRKIAIYPVDWYRHAVERGKLIL